MGHSLLGLGTRPFRRRPVRVDRCLPRPVALKAVVDHMGKRVLAREIKIEGFRASTRTEDGADAAAPYEAASPNPSA